MSHVPTDLSTAFTNDLRVLARRSTAALGHLPVPPSRLPPAVGRALDELASCAHALAGTARLLGLDPVADLAKACETEAEAAQRELGELHHLLDRIATRLSGMPPAWTAMMAAATDLVMVSAPPLISREAPRFVFIDEPELATVTAPTAFDFVDSDDSPTALPPRSAVPNAYVAAFNDEAVTLLASADERLASLDAGAVGASGFITLMRIYHTLKGSAHTVGLTALGDALHDLEDRVEAVAHPTAQVPAGTIAALGAVHEGLRAFLSPEGAAALPRIAQAVRRLAAPTTSVATPEEHPDEVGISMPPTSMRSATTGDQSDVIVHDGVQPAAGHIVPLNLATVNLATVRVSTGSLDQLLDLSGELVSSRSRMGRRIEEVGRLSRDLARWRRRAVPEIRRLVRTIAKTGGVRRGPLLPAIETAAGIELDRYDEAVILARRIEEYDDRVTAIEADLRRLGREAGSENETLGLLATRLHRQAAAVRLIPFASLVPRLRLAVCEAADRLGRDVTFTAEDTAAVIDITLAAAVSEALLHVVRNAVDHGIRPRHERLARGQPATGSIHLAATTSAGALVITVTDDGPGLDVTAIRQRARALGVPLAESTDAAELVFLPGFSTRSTSDSVSGRGIGLDAARSGLDAIGGHLTLVSPPTASCCFSLRLPAQTTIAHLLIATIGGQRLAVADLCCERIESLVAGQTEVGIGDERIPVVAGGSLLNLTAPAPTAVVVIRAGGRRLAMGVDAIVGREEAVIQPLSKLLASNRLFAGVVVPGDGAPVTVLDVVGLLALARLDQATPGGVVALAPAYVSTHARVLLVDDSLAVRKVGERFLIDAGYEVVTAIDGTEALEILRAAPSPFAAIITDLEMPRTNGFQLLSTVRAHPHLRHTPLAIMSSRRGENHRAEAARLGADAYLTKPFTPADLAEFVANAAIHLVVP